MTSRLEQLLKNRAVVKEIQIPQKPMSRSDEYTIYRKEQEDDMSLHDIGLLIMDYDDWLEWREEKDFQDACKCL